MPRDYKHRGRSRRASRRDEPPGWQWLLAGLGLGLVVALGVFVYDRRPGGVVSAREATPVPSAKVDQLPGDEPVEDRAGRFQFYDMLPKFEVVIPERERAVAPGSPARSLAPGSYVLQAGSFRNFADADRMKASLALLGVESRIQNVTIDKDTWHRVRIGPIDELSEIDRLRQRLREEHIEVLTIKVEE